MWLATLLAACPGFAAEGPADFDPFHESKADYDARAQWLRDAKFGVFLHWNPSSLIGREISWCRNDYGREQYDALYKGFKGERFRADEWVALFRESGIRYAVVVPKHHDGFCMWDTKTSDYNVMHSPFGRDYLRELSDACHRGGLTFCLYYSVLDWWNPRYSGKAGADLTAYKNEVFKPHLRELLTQYGPVGCIWFDGHWEPSWTHADGREMYAFARRLQPATLLGNRIDQRFQGEQGPNCSWTGSFFAPDGVGDYQAREVDLGTFYAEKAWDCCFSLCGVNSRWSWFPPMTPRPLPEVLGWMIQCIGRDGALLLGVGPRPDGAIDPASAARLLEVGDWLKLNGEAVYGTRGGPYLPGRWGVSTRKGDRVFLFITKWKGDAITLPPLPAGVKSVRLLSGGILTRDGWTFRVPEAFHRPAATIVELTLDRDAMALPVIEVPAPRNLALGKPVEVSSVWPGRPELVKEFITDGKPATLWATEEMAREGWVIVDLQEEREVSEALLSDAPYARIRSFDLEAQVGGQWRKIAEGTTIGGDLHLDFPPVKARRFRLNIRQAADTPTLSEFHLLGK
jgi:alpha-L-fucosidase